MWWGKTILHYSVYQPLMRLGYPPPTSQSPRVSVCEPTQVQRVYRGVGAFDENNNDATADDPSASPPAKLTESGENASVVVRSSTGEHAGEGAEAAAMSATVKLKVSKATVKGTATA